MRTTRLCPRTSSTALWTTPCAPWRACHRAASTTSPSPHISHHPQRRQSSSQASQPKTDESTQREKEEDVPIVTLFTGPHCSLCDDLKHALRPIHREHPFALHTYDIHDASLPGHREWHRRYRFDIPVLHVGGSGGGASGNASSGDDEVLRHRLTPAGQQRLIQALTQARRRVAGGRGRGHRSTIPGAVPSSLD